MPPKKKTLFIKGLPAEEGLGAKPKMSVLPHVFRKLRIVDESYGTCGGVNGSKS